MVMLVLGIVAAVLVVAGLLLAYRWARPPVQSYAADGHGRTKEQARAVELVTSLTVNHNSYL
jgi:hypothetical protein